MINIKKTFHSIGILFLILIFANGCTNSISHNTVLEGEAFKEQKQPETSSQTMQSPQLSQDKIASSISSKQEEQFDVTDSDRIDGWKKLKAKVFLDEMTNFGGRRGSVRLEGSRMVDYSIDFPGNWTLQSTIFDDSNNKKVAELFPVVLLKQNQESDFLVYNLPQDETGEKVVEKKRFNVNKYAGLKLILQVDTGYGIWYPHMYFLSNSKYGFSLALYSYSSKSDAGEEKLFNDIVNSFRFEE